jgi:O-antigen ligase/polysaccharide polymerase Wzy-like membrane protein
MSGARGVERLRACGRAALMVLAALLPFEKLEPLARIGPLQLSSVELFLYLALGVWGATLIAGWWAGERDLLERLERAPFAHRAVAAFGLVLLLSAAVAPAARGTALKFALRSLGGMLLYAAAADLLRAPGATARVAKALVAGGLAAASLAVAEGRSAQVGALLHSFHLKTFEALGHPRASGPFQYPNIAAMYLEAVAPLAAALGAAAFAARPSRRTCGGLCGVMLALLLLLDGVLATASRAGLVGGLAAVAALAVFYGRRPETRALAPALLATVLLMAALASSSALGGRFRFWQDGDWYRAVVTPSGGREGRLPPVLAPGSTATEILEVENRGALPWLREPPCPVVLSYHWLEAGTDAVVVRDGLRTIFPGDLHTGGRVQVLAKVRAPAQPGRYILWWDLVQEHTTWFSERGDPGLREPVVVDGPAVVSGAGVPARPAQFPIVRPDTPDENSRRTLWRGAVAAWRAHPLLGIGPDNFRHLSGQFLAHHRTDERMHANSLYFETLADLGMVGMLALLTLVAALAGAARRAVAAPASRILALGVAAGLATYLLHGLLDYFLEFTPTYALFWLLAGMMVAMDRSPETAA